MFKVGWIGLFLVVAIAFIYNTAYSAGVIDLPKTGQTKCYDVVGNEITCANSGQDGEKQAGVSWPDPRFIDNGDGTITDRLTGLMWLKDANCIGSRYPNLDLDNVKYDGSVTWEHALQFVEGVNSGIYNCGTDYRDWRLPNILELDSLMNAGRESEWFEWLNSQGFQNVQWWGYWSSTSFAYDTSYALWWADGMMANLKVNDKYVWPVRGTSSGPARLWKTGQKVSYAKGDDGEKQAGVSWPDPRFIDNGDGTITDRLTGLMWTKNAFTPNSQCSLSRYLAWGDAFQYIACLNNKNFLGYNDWRIPNRKEILSLVDYSRFAPALPQGHPFTNVQAYGIYFTSTSYPFTSIFFPTGPAYYYRLDMGGGVLLVDDKYHSAIVWPVRSGVNIKVLYPNNGEVLASGGSYTIQWQAPANAHHFTLKLSMDNGMTWSTIATNITGLSHNWDVPTPWNNKRKCFIKVIGYNANNIKVGADRSDGPFTIEVVKLNTPNGGETLTSGSTYDITWTTNATKNSVSKVILSYTLDGGLTWKSIYKYTGGSNPGTHTWTVPGVSTTKTKCKVKVVLKDSAGNTIGSDVSDGYFTIQP